MLDIKFIRENSQKVQDGAYKKGVQIDISRFLFLEERKRNLLREIENDRAAQNKMSKEKIDGLTIEKARILKAKIKQLQEEFDEIGKELQGILEKIPNLPFDDVPVGKDEADNVPLKKVGKIPKFDFQPKEHWEIGKALDIIDTERAGKLAGTRFYYLKREAALLELALINLAFKNLVKKGFIPVIPPVMINPKMAWAMGYLQQTNDEEAYFLPQDNLYLTATSEQSLGAMHAGEILAEKNLPLRYVGFSTCFRREAGSYGKDTKGILRSHQFDKIEMFVFTKPEDSAAEHRFLLACEEELMQSLKIPYQVVHICTGDLGMPAARKYDIETWMPGQNKYRETHSCSNCTDFQARRLNVRFRDKTGNLRFVHTLNGTAFSMRPLIAILENFQKKDGTITVPKVLYQYLSFRKIPSKK